MFHSLARSRSLRCLQLLLIFFIAIAVNASISAQNFPWGSSKAAPKIEQVKSEVDSLYSISDHHASNNFGHLEQVIENSTGEELVSKLRSFKPGMLPFHLQHFGEKLNFDSLYHIRNDKKHSVPANCSRGKWVVYGYHPYWMGSAWKSYNFKTLSHVAYFAYEVDLSTGAPSNIGDWATTPMIDSAHAAGCKVHLTVTTVGSRGYTRQMLNNDEIGQTCIDSLAYWVRHRKADGVSIDFEDMTSQDTSAFVQWVKKLRTALRKDNPNAEITIACGASGPSPNLAVKSLGDLVDLFVIMGYDYAYSGSKQAGCTAPLPYPNSWLNLETSVDNYLKAGVPNANLVLALPYYGYQWETNGDSRSQNTTLSSGTAVTFRQLIQNISTYEANFDSSSMSSFYVKPYGENYQQAWVLDSLSMVLRFELVKEKQLAGMGIWALGYDNGQTALWDALHLQFGECDSTQSESGVFHWPKHASAPTWYSNNHWKLILVCVFALLLLAIVLLLSPKARAEVLNRYLTFPFAAFVLLVICLMVYEYVHDYLFWMSARFPWFLLLGTFILIMGFYFGRWWTDKRNHDR